MANEENTAKILNLKKHIKRIVWILVSLVFLAAAVFGIYKLFNKTDSSDLITDTVYTGSITTKIGGSGVTVAKNSASITLLSEGMVEELFVKAGDNVTAGTPLYRISSDVADNKLRTAGKDVDDINKQIADIQRQRAELVIKAPHDGIILDAAEFSIDEKVSTDRFVCRIVDDSKMKVSAYYSYAYEDMVYVGQDVTVSIPSKMISVQGKIDSIYKVRRVSNEGSLLFEAVTVIDNPGVLAEGMSANATLMTSSGELITPYEDSKLEYINKTEIKAKASGPVEKINLRNYDVVKKGDVLLKLGESDNESQLITLEAQLKNAETTLKNAKEDLEKLNATAPIDGTVLSIGVVPGQKAAAGTVAISIADTKTMLVNIDVDEMDVSHIEVGMPINIDQWGNAAMGIVESVSLTGKFENGVSKFPAVISIDNQEDMFKPGSYVQWNIDGSQSTDCLILPIQSVKSVETEEGTASVVFVQSDSKPENAIDLPVPFEEIPEKERDRFYAVPVETGISDNYSVEILSGVNEGDVVFTQIRKESSWN